MNNELFQIAKNQYEAKDYAGALQSFNDCVNDSSNPLQMGEMGLIYHQIGNCLVKLNKCNDAIAAYSQATADSGYDAIGSVQYNLGMAYASLKDYEDAVKHFEGAVADGKYSTPYKAFFAMGNALMKIGKSAEAGVAFRQAALDEKNPDPTKSLLNLGVCFMALDRPNDAVVSYESALQFDMQPAVRNKLYANLGQAYVSCGQMAKACNAFEEALIDKSYFLSDSASVDYQRAIAAVSQGNAEVGSYNDVSGLDIVENDYYADEYYEDEQYADEYDNYSGDNSNIGGYYDEDGVWHDEPLGEERFFNATDEEIERFAQGNEKADRKRKNKGLKAIIAVIIAIVVIFGGGIAAYILGFGFPTQESVATDLFKDPSSASTKLFAPEISEAKAEALASMIPEGSTVNVEAVQKSMSDSTVYVKAETKEGGTIYYQISMVRDLIGWKISNINFWFTSQN